MLRRLFEGDHPDVVRSLSNLAIDVRALGEHRQALELDEQAPAMRQRLAER
jgi:Tetratricopeptide repeat